MEAKREATKMNAYEIEGQRYEGRNEYEAVKKAYKMANGFELVGYVGYGTWRYNAIFASGEAIVTVKRTR